MFILIVREYRGAPRFAECTVHSLSHDWRIKASELRVGAIDSGVLMIACALLIKVLVKDLIGC